MQQWLLDQKWSPESASRWQEFYNNAPRLAYGGRAKEFEIESLPKIPVYNDLKAEECQRVEPDKSTAMTTNPVMSTTRTTTSAVPTTTSKAIHRSPYVFVTLISCLITSLHQ